MSLLKTLSYLLVFYVNGDDRLTPKTPTHKEMFAEAFKEASIDIAKKMGYKIEEQ